MRGNSHKERLAFEQGLIEGWKHIREGEKIRVICDYDENADVLYLSFDKPEDAICYDTEIPVLVRYNPATDRISGITILNLKSLWDKKWIKK